MASSQQSQIPNLSKYAAEKQMQHVSTKRHMQEPDRIENPNNQPPTQTTSDLKIGYVVDEQEQPVAGALIKTQLEDRSFRTIGTTDKNGYFCMERPADMAYFGHILVTSADETMRSDILAGNPDHVLPNGEMGTLVVLKEIAVLHLSVFANKEGNPLAGAELTYFDDDVIQDKKVVTDEQGRITLKRLPQELFISVTKKGFYKSEKLVPLRSGNNEVTVVLKKERFLEGHVLDPDQNPIEKARVALRQTSSFSYYVETDETGYYQQRGDLQGTWRIRVEHDNYRPQAAEITFPEGTTLQSRDFVLEPKPEAFYDLTGTVLSPNNTPIAGVLVERVGTREVFDRTYSDANGIFTFQHIPLDERRYELTHEDFAGLSYFADPQNGDHVQTTLKLPQQVTLTGKVLQPDGRPYHGYLSVFFDPDRSIFPSEPEVGSYLTPPNLKVERDGTLRFNVPVGALIRLNAPKFPNLEIGPFNDSQDDIVWQLVKDQFIADLSDEKTGEPITNFSFFQFYRSLPSSRFEGFHPRGRLLYDFLYDAGEPMQLEVCAQGYQCRIVEVPANPEQPYPIRLKKSKTMDIQGIVVDEHGKPKPGVPVIAVSNNLPVDVIRPMSFLEENPGQLFRRQQITDRNGRFQFQEVECSGLGIHVGILDGTYLPDLITNADQVQGDLRLTYPTPARIFGKVNIADNPNCDKMFVNYTDFQQKIRRISVDGPLSSTSFSLDKLRPGYYTLTLPIGDYKERPFRVVTLLPGEEKEIDLGFPNHYGIMVSGNFPDLQTAVLQVDDGEKQFTQVVPIAGNFFLFSHHQPADIHYWILDGAADPTNLPPLNIEDAGSVRLEKPFQRLNLWPTHNP